MAHAIKTSRALALPLFLALVALLGGAFAGCGGGYASRARTRYLAEHGAVPRPEEIRSEDFLADYAEDAPAPNPNAAGLSLSAARATYGIENEPVTVVQATVRGRDADRRPPLALMLVVDRSGSMQEQDKMTYVREAIGRLTAQLDPQDAVGIVAFDDRAELLLPLTRATEVGAIARAAAQLSPRGGTNLSDGLLAGYGGLAQAELRGALRRVVLLTDAQANLGETDLRRIGDYAEAGDEEGIRLSCIGVGLSYHDGLMEEMARRGRGNHYFLDSPREIRRVFEAEVHGVLEDVADEVTLRFSPAPGLELLHVDGGEPQRSPEGDEVVMPLARLGAGQHRVVLLTLRGTLPGTLPGQGASEAAGEHGAFAPGAIRLSYRDMRDGQTFVQDERGAIALAVSPAEGTVVRNAVVASMARALRAAASLHQQGRNTEARAQASAARASLFALIEARPEEEELRRDLQMVEGILRALPEGDAGDRASDEGDLEGYRVSSYDRPQAPVISVSAAAPYNQRATVQVR